MTIGVIVDGPGDLLSLKAKYPGRFKILKTDGPRGHAALPEQIIGKAKKQIYMLRDLKCSKVIIMLDFESRNCTYSSFFNDLVSAAQKYELGVELLFVVPNQMIENWYLADIEIISRNKAFMRGGLSQKKYEGLYGKGELKKLFKKEYTYNETTHGPQLFVEIRESVASENSESFKAFVDIIGSTD